MQRRVLSAFLLALAACPLAFAEPANFTGFEDLGFAVEITVNADGSAHVKEDVQLIVYPNALELYKQSLLSTRFTIQDWKNTTGSQNLRYHVGFENATQVNTRVFPQPLQRLQFVNRSIATITLEYDTSAPIFTVSGLGPRLTGYALKPEALSFASGLEEGQRILAENTVLSITIPVNSRVDLGATFPRLSSPKGGGVSTARTYLWNATGGAIPLTPMEFSFETEQSLDEEVSGYFSALQASMTHLIFSNYGAVALFLAVVLAGTYLALKQMKAL